MSLPQIPAHVLFGGGTRSAPSLSPDGERIAFVDQVDGVSRIHVGRTAEPAQAKPIPASDDRDVRGCFWSPSGRELMFARDGGGDEQYRLYAADAETGEIRPLADLPGGMSIAGSSAAHPDTLLLSIDTESNGRPDLHKLDTSTGTIELTEKNPGFTRWLTDTSLQVKGGVRLNPDGSARIDVRDEPGGEWRAAIEFGPEDAMLVAFPSGTPIQVVDGGNALSLVTSKGFDTQTLVRLDLATGELSTVAQYEGYDLIFVTHHPDTHQPQFATVYAEKYDYVVVDSAIEADLEAIRSGPYGRDAFYSIVSRDAADRKWIYQVSSDAHPGSYHLYDRDNQSSQLLWDEHPDLSEYVLAPKTPFRFTARDGLEIQGYLTFPPEGPRTALPTVVKPHGGPWHRDPPGWEGWTQFFANRGYLCVQLQYRGSLGFGKKFLDAGDKEWGRKMHFDVVDAIRHVIDQGWADPERLGMFGTSYGGYETMTTVTQDPDLVKCAVAGMAPVDLTAEIGKLFAQFGPLFARRIGDPETDQDLLWERSPIRQFDKINVPLMVFYSGRDPRVGTGQGEALLKALDAAGVDYEHFVLQNAGHFVESMSREDKETLTGHVERFFAKHLLGQ